MNAIVKDFRCLQCEKNNWSNNILFHVTLLQLYEIDVTTVYN